MAARYEFVCGRHDRCKTMIESIFSHTAIFEDKVDAYFTLACSLGNQSKNAESIDVLIDALQQMGEKNPKKHTTRIQKVVGFVKRRESKNHEPDPLTEDELYGMAPIVDQKERNKMKFMSILFLNSYYSYEKEIMWFVLKQMLALTRQHGVCKYTPLAVAAQAYNLANRGDFVEGSRYGEMATKVLDKLHSKINLPIVTFFLVVFVNHLRKPMYKSLPDLKRGFQVGMENGDSQAAFLCATTDVCYQFMIGNHLHDNTESCATYFRVAHEYGQDQLKKEILLMWQLTANLVGLSENPTTFDGSVMNEKELMHEIMFSPQELQIRFYVKYLMALGDVYLGLWEEASDYFHLVLSYDDKNRLVTSHYSTCFSTVYGAVTWFKVLGKKSDRKLSVKAGKALNALKGWVEKGAINLAAGLFFAEAQKAALDQPFDVVKKAFDKAIVGLHRCGPKNLEGLACQCFAEYAMEKEDLEWAADYMKRAHQRYMEWGAKAVVSKLESVHDALLKE